MINALSAFLDGAFLIIFIFFFYLGLPMVSPSKITLPQGSITAIIAYLSKNGLDINQLDKYILRALGKPQSGEIDISYLMKKPREHHANPRGDDVFFHQRHRRAAALK